MTPRLRRIGYGAYFIAAAMFFLYYLFPSEALTAYLAHQLSGGQPDLSVRIEQIKPILPPGLKLKPVSYARNGRHLLELSQMSVRPQLISLLRKGTVYNFDATAYGGRISGEAGPFEAESGRVLGFDARLNSLPLERIPALSLMPSPKLSGRLNGSLSLDEQGRLKANLAATQVRMQMKVPLFGVESLDFQMINADLALEGDLIVLQQCSLKGAEMDGTLSGGIQLSARNAQAVLDLKGTISPHHAFLAKLDNRLSAGMLQGKDKIGFKLTGPLASPSISFE